MARDEAYLRAEEKIEAARQLEAQELHLDGRRIIELPKSLGKLTQLRVLNLYGNELMVLPERLGRLTQLRELNLSNNHLTALPEWIGQLTQLRRLSLSHNQLTELPESLGRLTLLQGLFLSSNQLTELPDSLGRLTQLHQLSLSRNPLTTLPEWLGRLPQLRELVMANNPFTELPDSLGWLTQLQGLGLWNNQLTALPEWLGRLTQLQRLDLSHNQLMKLPEWLDRLSQLQGLCLSHNQLTALPEGLGRFTQLQRLDLDGNPLNPELAAADKGGIEAVKRHLRALAEGGRKRYEAKLLILGDGNEGKTCVSRALRGLPFEEPKPTHGMDVGQWTFAHPDDPADRAKDITLNIWDFEGREISHQTHQFFLTSQSLYLLVFKCRDQFQMDRAEYWLDTIRARAPRAKVVLVISQCEERTPRVPLDRLHAQFGDLLAREWFFPVGCENGLNVEKLRACLQRSAADLDFMGAPWPASYALAEPAVQPGAKTLTLHSRRTSSLRSLPKQGSARTTSIMPPRSPVWG